MKSEGKIQMIKPGQAEYAEAIINILFYEIFEKYKDTINDEQKQLIQKSCIDEAFSRFESSKEI